MQLLLADSLIFLSIPTAGLDIFFFSCASLTSGFVD